MSRPDSHRFPQAQSVDRSVHRSLLTDMSFELIPLKNVQEQMAYLPNRARVSVTCSPTKRVDDTLDLCSVLADAGHHPIPHIAARMVEGEDHLDQIVTRLSDQGIRTVFTIGGDADQRGPFSDAVGFLRAFLDRQPEIDAIGIGAYPDGHPVIPDEPLIEALSIKQSIILEAGLDGYFATQMCFDPDTIVDWLLSRRAAGVNLPCHLGAPGDVEPSRLLSISLRLGVGASTRYLKKNRASVLRLLSPRRYDANKLLAPLSARAEELGIEGVHCFTFNSVEATEAWRRRSMERLV